MSTSARTADAGRISAARFCVIQPDASAHVTADGGRDETAGGGWVTHFLSRLQGPASLTRALNAIVEAAPITVDGQYGPATATLIRAIQARYKITVDGIAGPQTWSVLLTGSPG